MNRLKTGYRCWLDSNDPEIRGIVLGIPRKASTSKHSWIIYLTVNSPWHRTQVLARGYLGEELAAGDQRPNLSPSFPP
jgi:hypothetical protein